MDRYRTIARKSTGEFKDKGSKFIGYAFPVKTEEQAKERIDEITKEHPKSRHVCFAYRLGTKEPLERNSDAGEPSGTAGKPIFGQILSHELTNIVIIVVRYFGGTLLGVSGLINAYRSAATAAIQNNKIITKEIKAIYNLSFGYDIYHELMNLLKQENVDFLKEEMTTTCYLQISIDKSQSKQLEEKLANFNGLQLTFIEFD